MAQLYFYYSAMNAGKSTLLLQSAHNYQEQGMNVMLYTAAIDNRYGEGRIRSRIGLEQKAEVFVDSTDFLDDAKRAQADRRVSCLLVDEAQFLTRAQVDQLAQVVDELNIPVLCFGIRTDFLGETFAGSARLLAVADKLSELKTVCECGRKATMTLRIDAAGCAITSGDQVVIGGNDKYISKCRHHHRQAMSGSTKV